VGGFVLSPFVGAYYLLPLNVLDAGTAGSYKIDPPLGLSLRFDYDIGLTSVGKDNALRYSRKRMELFAGYKFALGRRQG
jgi:hypothetical protein